MSTKYNKIRELWEKYRINLPLYRSCCCCIPINYGLVIWAYLRLVSSITLLVEMVKLMNDELMKYFFYDKVFTGIFILVFILTVMDVIFNLVLLAATNLKKAILYLVYFYHNIFVLTWLAIIFLIIVCLVIHYNIIGMNLMDIAIMLAAVVIVLAHIYVTVLVRSEWKKHRDREQNKEHVTA